MHEEIVQALKRTGEQHGVRVLYAVESGSRAWGFASPNSDYDVRFVYAHDLDGYLTVQQKRDVIEEMLPNDIDLAGWDLRKTLHLMKKSNPSLFEWLHSPIVYAEDPAFMAEFRTLAQHWYSEHRIFLHYMHMAQGNWKTYLQGEEVSRKKYLYVLRPTLACRWIEEGRGGVPMAFEELLVTVNDETKNSIHRLVQEKMAGDELAVGPQDPVLHKFLAEEMERLPEVCPAEIEAPDIRELDVFFRRWVLSAETYRS